jgi:hypothetical protein
MDFYADMPMPSMEQRISKLLTFIDNPTNHHIAVATQVASETKNYSLMGYSMGHIDENEKTRFLQLVLP